MLIAMLISKQKRRVQQNSLSWQQQQKLLRAECWLLQQRCRQFIVSTPGLMISFGLGCLMQYRHHTVVKTVRRAVGLGWLRLF